MLSASKINTLFENLHTAIPSPETELIFNNHFELLIAVILSAQATDKSVNKATPELFTHYPTPELMAEAELESILELIKTIGLANTKAKNIIATSQQLIKHHQGKVPSNRKALEALAGVGRKTANVILNTAFGQATIAVDTHVFRVSNRTGIVKAKNVIETEEQLLKVIPKKWKIDAHHYLVLHGRYVCTARAPKCNRCPITQQCTFTAKNI